jgi:hypothetical protein
MISNFTQLAQFNEPDMTLEFAEHPIITEPIAVPDPGAGALLGTLIPFILTIFLIVLVYAGLWKTFRKAGVQGWKAIIPLYNFWTLFRIAGKPGWWSLLPWAGISLLVPIVVSPALHFTLFTAFLLISATIAVFIGIVLWDIMGIDLSKAFGKSTAFSVLCWVYFPILGPILLGFGKAQYTGPASQPQALPQAPPQVPLQPPQASPQTPLPPQSLPPQAPPQQGPPPQQTPPPPPPQAPIPW